MKWNIENIKFLHQPDDFTGNFGIPQMQERHERQLQKKLLQLKTAIALESDPLLAMNKLHVRDHLPFFLDNTKHFHESSRYEETLLDLYGKLNAPFSSGGDPSQWHALFEECDRGKLQDLGEPLTMNKATLYRGSVTGFTRSISWTPDRKRAESFASRWNDPSLGGGELFEVETDRSVMLILRKLRHDIEILVEPSFIETADIQPFVP